MKNMEGRKILVYNTYIPPGEDHYARVDAFIMRFNSILARYKDCKLIVYGDFNLSRDDFEKKVMSRIKGKNIKAHYDKAINVFTRCRVLENGTVQSSYLDYFITVNIEVKCFSILKPIGGSDHWLLEMKIGRKEKEPVFPRR